MVWISLYFKWWTMIHVEDLLSTLPLVLLAYILVTAISNLQVLWPWMLVFPLYSLLQILVMPPVGAVYYVVLARDGTRSGAIASATAGAVQTRFHRSEQPPPSRDEAAHRLGFMDPFALDVLEFPAILERLAGPAGDRPRRRARARARALGRRRRRWRAGRR